MDHAFIILGTAAKICFLGLITEDIIFWALNHAHEFLFHRCKDNKTIEQVTDQHETDNRDRPYRLTIQTENTDWLPASTKLLGFSLMVRVYLTFSLFFLDDRFMHHFQLGYLWAFLFLAVLTLLHIELSILSIEPVPSSSKEILYRKQKLELTQIWQVTQKSRNRSPSERTFLRCCIELFPIDLIV